MHNFDLIPNFGYSCRYLLRCRLTQIINKSQTSLLCTTPYFVPDEYLLKALIGAAKRGVQVKLLVPFESDHVLVNILAKYYYNRLLQVGIKIYAYMPRFIHAKTLVVDSQFSLIGTANLDYRSLFINHEIVCLFKNKAIAENMTNIFQRDCQSAITINATTRFKNVKNWWLWRPVAALLKHWI
jgi:cardiolipin synthase